MLISDQERETLVQALGQHLAAGRIDLEEYERRVGIVYGARHQEDADAAFADLPRLPAASPRPTGRRHGETSTPEPQWRPTDEVFRDPASGRVTRVWVDPITGSRHYIPQG